MIWNARIVRLGVGLLLLLVGVVAILPSLTGYSSVEGTVNARFIVVFAPIEGAVTKSAPRPGTPLIEGAELLRIKNDRVNRTAEAQIDADLHAAQERLTATKEQQATLTRLQDDLRKRLREHQEANIENLNSEVAIRQQRIPGATAHQRAARSDLTRQQTLGETGLVSKKTVENALDSSVTAVGDEAIARTTLNQLDEQLAALRRGIFVGQDRNDVPYSQQRIDEITIQLATLLYQQEDQQTLGYRLEKQLGLEHARNETLQSAIVRMPFTGVLWRNNVVEGSNVIGGTELLRVLDCRELFVDILLSAVDFDRIYPGREADVRLLGGSEVLKGVVMSVRGSAAIVDQVTVAATPPKPEGENAQIRIALPPSRLQTDYANFCQVGRSVQVRFEGRSFPLGRWLKSLWFSIA
jgi:multidrug resistance efflux pump